MKKDTRCQVEPRAFTRFDLVAIIGTMTLLVLVALPVLAGNRERSMRLLCVSNLQQLGQGHHQWSTDHGGRLPVRTPWCEGGTSPLNYPGCTDSQPLWVTAGLFNNVWFHYAPLSNELRSPKVLACPGDMAKTPATQWGSSPVGGFLHPNFQNRATSYIVQTDTFADFFPGTELLTADRNFRHDQLANNCSAGLAPVRVLHVHSTNTFDGSVHVDGGNLLLLDGSVKQLSDREFIRTGVEAAVDMNGQTHYVAP